MIRASIARVRRGWLKARALVIRSLREHRARSAPHAPGPRGAFHWDALKSRNIPGYPGTLQDHWLADPTTAQPRSEATLVANREIIVVRGRKYHRAHAPASFKNDPSRWSEADWEDLEAEIEARARRASLTRASPDGRALGSEGRVLLHGAVVRTLPTLGPEPLHIHCRNTQFLDNPFKLEPTLGPSACFLDAQFSGPVTAGSAKFTGDVCFDRADFAGDVRFSPKVRFLHRVSFVGSWFRGIANFNDAVFTHPVNFVKARFFGPAQFRGAKFRKAANFKVCRFVSEAEFIRAEMSDYCHFNRAIFAQNANFANAQFKQSAIFYNAQFGDVPEFEEATVHANSTFSRARFTALRPIFLKSWALTLCLGWISLLIHAELQSVFPWYIRFPVALSPLLIGIWTSSRWFVKDRELERLVRAFRHLSQRAADFNDREGASAFLREELRAQRLRMRLDLIDRGLSFVYDAVAEYGNTLARPLLILVTVVCAFAFLYWTWEKAPPSVYHAMAFAEVLGEENPSYYEWREAGYPIEETFIEATRFSLRAVFQPFGVWSTAVSETPGCTFQAKLMGLHLPPPRRDEIRCLADWMDENTSDQRIAAQRLLVQITATLETLIAALLLFLSGLAARRRFQVSA